MRSGSTTTRVTASASVRAKLRAVAFDPPERPMLDTVSDAG